MKGYTNVSVADIKSALTNWRDKYNQGEVIRDKGIDLYYEKHYTNGSWFTKFSSKRKTPDEFTRKRIQMFGRWDEVLWEVLDKDELEILEMWIYNRHKDAYIAVKSLMNASEEGDILLDDQLCWFVNKYKEVKDV